VVYKENKINELSVTLLRLT